MSIRFGQIPEVVPFRPGPQDKLRAVDAAKFVGAAAAAKRHRVNGCGTTVALLDTGVRDCHFDFRAKSPSNRPTIAMHRNVTGDNFGDPVDAWDGGGHGTHVAGTLVAVAPGVKIMAVKVLCNDRNDAGPMEQLRDGLDIVLEQGPPDLAAVCLSLGDDNTYTAPPYNPAEPMYEAVAERIERLAERRIAVVAAAGNHYRRCQREGMCFPAILPSCISVGAVHDEAGDVAGRAPGGGGAVLVQHVVPGQLLPTSARLRMRDGIGTTVFAPGADIVAAGIRSDGSKTTLTGTSQAAPIVAGAIALMQHYHRRERGCSAEVGQLRAWLRQGARTIVDAPAPGPAVLVEDPNTTPPVRATRATLKLLSIDGAFAAMLQSLADEGARLSS